MLLFVNTTTTAAAATIIPFIIANLVIVEVRFCCYCYCCYCIYCLFFLYVFCRGARKRSMFCIFENKFALLMYNILLCAVNAKHAVCSRHEFPFEFWNSNNSKMHTIHVCTVVRIQIFLHHHQAPKHFKLFKSLLWF